MPCWLSLLRSPFTLVSSALQLVLGLVSVLETLPNWVTSVPALVMLALMPLSMPSDLLSRGLRLRTLIAQFGDSRVLLPDMALAFVTTPSSADPFVLPGLIMLTPVFGRKDKAILLRTIPLLRVPWVPWSEQTHLVMRLGQTYFIGWDSLYSSGD